MKSGLRWMGTHDILDVVQDGGAPRRARPVPPVKVQPLDVGDGLGPLGGRVGQHREGAWRRLRREPPREPLQRRRRGLGALRERRDGVVRVRVRARAGYDAAPGARRGVEHEGN